MAHISKIQTGTVVRVLWMKPNDDTGAVEDQWYQGTVLKVHRKDRRCAVCHIIYEDGEEETGGVLKEKYYGYDWCLDDDEADDEADEDIDEKIAVVEYTVREVLRIARDVSAKATRTNCILAVIMATHVAMLVPQIISSYKNNEFPSWEVITERLQQAHAFASQLRFFHVSP